MRFEHDGIALWYGTPDAPAPGDTVPVADGTHEASVTITVGVQPPSASNSVSVSYSVNNGLPHTVAAGFLQHDVHQKAQYFAARLPVLQAGDKVDYTVLCRCPGRQVPSPEEAQNSGASFRVTGAREVPAIAPEPQHAARQSVTPGAHVAASPPASPPETPPSQEARMAPAMTGGSQTLAGTVVAPTVSSAGAPRSVLR